MGPSYNSPMMYRSKIREVLLLALLALALVGNSSCDLMYMLVAKGAKEGVVNRFAVGDEVYFKLSDNVSPPWIEYTVSDPSLLEFIDKQSYDAQAPFTISGALTTYYRFRCVGAGTLRVLFTKYNEDVFDLVIE